MKVVCIHRTLKQWEFTVGKEYEVLESMSTPQGKLYCLVNDFNEKTQMHEKYFEEAGKL